MPAKLAKPHLLHTPPLGNNVSYCTRRHPPPPVQPPHLQKNGTIFLSDDQIASRRDCTTRVFASSRARRRGSSERVNARADSQLSYPRPRRLRHLIVEQVGWFLAHRAGGSSAYPSDQSLACVLPAEITGPISDKGPGPLSNPVPVAKNLRAWSARRTGAIHTPIPSHPTSNSRVYAGTLSVLSSARGK